MLKTIIKFTYERKSRNTWEQILTHDRSDWNTCTKSTRLQGITNYYTLWTLQRLKLLQSVTAKVMKNFYKENLTKNAKSFFCTLTISVTQCGESSRDNQIVDFYYPILSCFWKMISVSDPNPVLVKIMLSVSENYPKVYYDAQHTFFV